jgi:hypothetical protein
MKIKNKVLTIVGLSLIFCVKAKCESENPQILDFENETPSSLSAKTIQQNLTSQKDTQEEAEDSKNVILKNFNNSLSKYINEQFNSEGYAYYISTNASHLLELLEIIKCLDEFGSDKVIYSYTIFKLFNDKLKSIELVDHTVIHQILDPLPKILGSYFAKKQTKYLDSIKRSIELMLQAKLTEHLTQNAYEPKLNNIYSDLSKSFLEIHQNEIEKLESENKLRNIIVRLLEHTLSKATWNSIFYQSSWQSFTTIAHLIKHLFTTGIIDDEDDIDSLYWSLVHRFNYFIEIMGSDLPVEFFDEIEDDLENELIPFLEEEEQDDFIKTKKEVLLESLLSAKTKALAFEKAGIIA